MKKNILISILSFLSIYEGISQEFNFNVTVNTPNIQSVDPKVFKSLELQIREFMNNTKWTDDIFEPQERIKGNIQLTIKKENSNSNFDAEIQIQALRPVYGSTYETPIFTHLDNQFTFSYEQLQPLNYTKNNFNDNLTGVLAFYANFILALDYDTYSLFGGDNYFQVAQDIVNLAPQGESGWSNRDPQSRGNRFWFVENILSPRGKPYRQTMYNYHRQGLDLMSSNLQKGRLNMVVSLDDIDKVNATYPNCFILRAFANTKWSELIEIFKKATPDQKVKLTQVMQRVDPANSSKLRELGL
jgi:Domain of unknown function (DUF4835)